MKKLISIVLVGMTVGSFTLSNASAADQFAKSNHYEPCNAISNNGWGSYFKSRNNSIDAVLYYNGKSGPGVSGGFGAVVNGNHMTAPLIESTCQWGTVTLKWKDTNFKGHLTGVIDLANARITNVNGTINGKKVNDDLIFVGR